MGSETHEAWEDAMARCCDSWRQCFQRALELADTPAKEPRELCLLQANWLAASAPRSFEFWQQLLGAADDTGERVHACLFARMQAESGEFARLRDRIAQAAARADAEAQASIAAVLNEAYSAWLKAAQAERKG
jgi:hypothetical protein